jgi:adenylate kinase
MNPIHTGPQSYIFIGKSGCGKGTQSDLLSAALKKMKPDITILNVETGRELREFIKGSSHTAQLTKNVINNGGLMPEFMPIYLWGKIFVDKFTGGETLIFDGTPRKIMEAHILTSLFGFYNLPKPWIIYLDVEHEEVMKRLKIRGRADDSEEDVKRRLAWYQTEVAPIVDLYRTDPNVQFLDINGNRSIQDVHIDIVKRVGLV